MTPSESQNDAGLIRRGEKTLRLVFRRKPLLAAALSHPSYRHECPRHGLEDFERLEYFGDAVLSFIVSGELYRLFPEAGEGTLSQIRSVLVSKKTLAGIARQIRLGEVLLLGTSERHRPEGEKEKILADALEALVAAAFLDRGLAKTKGFVLRLFKPHLGAGLLHRAGPSPKNLLQEWVQKHFGILPRYESVLKGRRFWASASVPRRGRAQGVGRSKKEAETRAAARLLALLKKKKKARLAVLRPRRRLRRLL